MTQSQGVMTPDVSRRPGTTPVVKILLAIAGAIAGLLAIGLIIGGIALVAVHSTQRDDDGFLTSPQYDMRTGRYALVSGDVDLASRPGDWWPSDPTKVKFNVDAIGTRAVFIGIGLASEVEQYLSGVSFDEVTSLGTDRDDVKYKSSGGVAPASLPGDQEFWVAASQGVGAQVLEWELDKGEWKLVLMNADGASGLRADVEAGVKINILLPIGIGLIVAGLVGLVVTVVFLVLAIRIGRQKDRVRPLA